MIENKRNLEEACLISVIMPVFNTKESYLREAVESILNQTYSAFELIIINDHSDEETSSVLRSYTDKRIRILNNSENLGITKSLNIGLKAAKGDYIARMDADDVSDRRRLERQLNYMEKHPEIIVLGSMARTIGGGELIGINIDESQELRKIRMSFYNDGVIHPTAFFRADQMRAQQLYYDERIRKAQDYEFWTRCIQVGEIQILPEILFNYRIHGAQISTKGKQEQDAYRDMTKLRMLKRLGTFTEREQQAYLHMTGLERLEKGFAYQKLCQKLIKRNKEKQTYSSYLYRMELRRLFLQNIKKQKQYSFLLGRFGWSLFYPSTLLYLWKTLRHNRMIKRYQSKLLKEGKP